MRGPAFFAYADNYLIDVSSASAWMMNFGVTSLAAPKAASIAAYQSKDVPQTRSTLPPPPPITPPK